METRMTIKFSDITGGGIPYGNTAGRPVNPGTGKLYSNGEAQRLELYTAAGSWENIVQEVPGVSSITGNYSEATNSGVITIYGTNFVNGAYATAIGSNGVQVNATSTTYNSLVQLTAQFANLSNQYEPYDIKVTNPSNLFGIIPDALYINASPVWQTSSGSLGTFIEQISVNLSATASDSDSTITYALASGSTLPSGVSLNSSTGAITGTLPDISSDTTYTFTINATDGLNVIPRTFSITSSAYVPVDYLVVAGGGAGGASYAGGGGAGGVLIGSTNLSKLISHQITVGNGGAAAAMDSGLAGANGQDSVASTLVAIGGGGGGSYGNNPQNAGRSGGSGGGSARETGGSGGAGTSGQGYAGGAMSTNSSGSVYRGGGGGGAGGVGKIGDGIGTDSGDGGPGISSSITGTLTYYGGGGGGGVYNSTSDSGIAGNGGIGGGGDGLKGGGTATSGTANTGGGGGGAGGVGSGETGGLRGGNGGSGVVVLAYPDTQAALTIPGTLTYDTPTRSGYRVYRFTAGTGTITF
jgi:hypothetical protein